MSRKALAENICSEKYIYLIEKGARNPSANITRLLGDRLGIDLFRYYEYLDCVNPLDVEAAITCFNKYRQENDLTALQKVTDEATLLPDFRKQPWIYEIQLNRLSFMALYEGKPRETIKHVEDILHKMKTQHSKGICAANFYVLLSTCHQMAGELDNAKSAVLAAHTIVRDKKKIAKYAQAIITTGTLTTGSGYPSTGSLETSGDALAPASISGLTAEFDTESDPQTATFTFEDLEQPYVILLKAKPTNDTFDGYLVGDNTRDETNTLSLKSDNWEPGKSVSQKVRIDSKILNKTLDLSNQNQGILTWSVQYTPLEREIGTGLEDILPEGIDLRTDSSGQLIWEQDGSRNINVHQLTLKDDGSGDYVEGLELALDVLKSSISYDNDTRLLTFTFPDEAQAYQLTYVTDITGMPGEVSNAVKLVDASGTGTDTDHSFRITAQQGAATMGRSGYLVVKKTNIGSNSLSGAEFTLYNTNADGSRGSSRAVRTTSNNGTVNFYGLAPGNYILVETEAPGGYKNPSLEYNVVVDSDLKTTVNGSAVITSSDPLVVVNYKTTDAVGSLTINKAVAGDGADTTKTFDFTLTLDGASGSYSYVGYGVPSGTIKSGDTISLAHGQSITIVGLPNDTTYTVTETDYSGDGYTATNTGETGTIVTNTTQTASFTNTRTVGNLAIAKTVAGSAGDRSKSFDFTLTLNGAADIHYAYIGNGVPDGTIKSGDMISLLHGQSITIVDLPKGATYTVTEADYSGDGYTTTSTGETGTIETNATQTASFTNTKRGSGSSPDTGDLIISKTVAGIGGDTDQKFNFTITFKGASDFYPYTGNGVPDGTMESGDTIALAHGQSITITGLPVGATYQVTEENAATQDYSVESSGSSGTISSSQDRTAAFTNTKVPVSTGSLTISKTVAGLGADLTKKFDFTVTFTGASDAYSYTGAAAGTIRSGDTISLTGGESITITGLPAGSQYTVTEADYTGAGYTATSTGAVGTIAVDTEKIAAFTNSHGYTPETPETPGTPETPEDPTDNIGDGDIPKGYPDTSGAADAGEKDLPKTGGSGTIGFYLAAGLGLVMMGLILRRKTI